MTLSQAFPARRLRRLRKHDFSRRLVAENQPKFVQPTEVWSK